MKKVLLLSLLTCVFQVVSAQTSRKYYWECSISIDSYSGQTQFLRGDGATSITVYFSKQGSPYKVISSNQELSLDYNGDYGEWSIYDTQFPLRKIWVNGTYVCEVAYLGNNPVFTIRYNPQRGVISGTQDGLNGGNYGGGLGNSPSGSHNNRGYRCPSCHGSGKCTMCNGNGWYRFNGGIYDCAGCRQSGRCQTCYGRGEVR